MTVKVRYFASLKDWVGCAEQSVDLVNTVTVKEIWQLANPEKDLPDNVLAAVNMDYVPLDHAVQSGDEVAFFPPVTGG